MSQIHVGTCGFSMGQADYFRTFGVVEVQQTFYQPPRLETVERWRHAAPGDFEFALKAFQAITHAGTSPTYRRSKLTEHERAECGAFRDTPTVRAAWQTTFALAQALRAVFVVFQCPASFGPSDEHLANLRRFFGWARRDGLRFGWEPRGREWTPTLVRDLCRQLDLVHVVDPFQDQPRHGTPRYYRLHGIGGYHYRYSDAELHHLRDLSAARETYCLFNNSEMRGDAERFLRMLLQRDK